MPRPVSPILFVGIFLLGAVIALGSRHPAAAQDSGGDKQFVEAAAELGLSRIAGAEDALTRVRDNRVRILAERIIEDHRPINEELALLATDAGIPIPEPPALLITAASSEEGTAFDQTWLKAEADAHEEMIRLFEGQAADGKDAKLRTFAANHLAALRDHLDIARSLGAELPPVTSAK